MDYLTVPEVGQPKEGEQAALSAAASHKPPSQSQLAGPRSATSRPSAHHSAYSTSVFSRSQHGPRGGKSGSKSTTLIRSRRVGSADHDGPGHGYQRGQGLWSSRKMLQKIVGLMKMKLNKMRQLFRKLIQSPFFEAFILLVVTANAMVLVAQTFAEMEIRAEWYFTAADSVFLSIYLLEAVLKIISLGSNYFFNAWNKLDFFITIMALLDFVLPQIYNAMTIRHAGTNTFRVLKVFKGFRALRIFRVLRRLRFLNSLQEVTGTLARSLASIGAILVLMFICLFLFSVILRALFRNTDPKRFQSLFTTLFTLFTMLTLDDWSLIYLDSRAKGAWFIVPILMVYIIIQYFIFLNLVVAVLVDNFQMELLKGLEQEKQEKAALLQEKLLDDSLTKLQETDKQEEMQRITVQDQIEREMKGLTERQQQLYLTFLQLIAGVEVQQQQLRSQTAITEEIVDTVFEAGEEDLKK
ncbi:cation channel sperm-associated protein 1 isoform X1 [Tachyglossus aculeatus]|uniref:cation channel sperm-associated protein 1 isoform X1 n=1 Tax=Tachyglossus aculeatus TaxID=9261 RepID=UPI0018F63A51|nr:cation channel sperm-associated protein 1 isoform X1 [Tachyglossus aculeatus]